MPLTDTGNHVQTVTGENADTRDSTGQPVTVTATSEVIRDFGWANIIEVASRKYDSGDYKMHGARPVVSVTTSDM